MKKFKINYKAKGFTLTELIVYMALLIVLISALSVMFSEILDSQLESESVSSIDLDSRYIIAKLMFDMHQMQIQSPVNDSIIEPSFAGSVSSTLIFTANSINYKYDIDNGFLELNNNFGVNRLNSINTAVSGLRFTRIGSGLGRDTIRINFTLTSNIKRKGGPEIKNYQTTISAQ